MSWFSPGNGALHQTEQCGGQLPGVPGGREGGGGTSGAAICQDQQCFRCNFQRIDGQTLTD